MISISKIVPFSQLLTKSIDPNIHFRLFFMLYANQITKIRKNIFLPNQTIPELVHGGCLEDISKIFLVPLWKSPMANETSFLITECPQFRVVILSDLLLIKKIN
jgi:hypothetical protein